MLTAQHRGWRIRIITSDLREFEGDLLAVDKEGNVLLQDTEEHRRSGTTRYIGLAGMRGQAISMTEILNKPYRKLQK